jgi:hypothetical protein
VTIFELPDGGLAGTHTGCKLGLRQAVRRRARSNSAGISNSGASASYSALTFGLGEQAGLQFFELDSHVMSFAVSRACMSAGRAALSAATV